jgi:hypothetical protein
LPSTNKSFLLKFHWDIERMDAHEYLKQLPPRPNSKLAPYIEDLRILYAGRATFASMSRFLSERYGVDVKDQSVWEFCNRHFSDLVSIRRGTKALGNDPSAPISSQGTRVDAVEQVRTEAVSSVTRAWPSSDVTSSQFDVDDGRSSMTHSTPTQDSSSLSVSPPSMRLPRDNSSSDSTTLSNEAQLGGAFPARDDTSASNMKDTDAIGALPADQLPAVSLFGPAENLRIPHDLNKQSGKERMARYLKAKAAREA